MAYPLTYQLYAAADAAAKKSPLCCHRNIRMIAKDYAEALTEFPDRTEEIIAQVRHRFRALQRVEMSELPPALFHRPGETLERHLDKCYRAFMEDE